MGVPTPGEISYCSFLEVKGLNVPLLLDLTLMLLDPHTPPHLIPSIL